MKKLLLLSLAACQSITTTPSPNPPPPWGVPISGGNMIVAHDGRHAIIADPDRDRVMSVDIASGATLEVPLSKDDEPGRLVEDAAGRIHVALRRGGAVVTLNDKLTVLARRPVCAEPRGIAVDGDSIDVACSGGELVTLPAAGGDPTRVLHLDRDLRDVLVVGGQLYVTRFRTAELLALDASGAVTSRVSPPQVSRPAPEGPELGSGSAPPIPAIAAVAWRTIALADGTIVMTHQRSLQTILHETEGGYGGNCGGGPVEDALTVVRPGQPPFAANPILDGALPVDTALSPDGTTLAVVLAGSGIVQTVPVSALSDPDDGGCKVIPDIGPLGPIGDDLGLPTSVAYAPDGSMLVYYPELPALAVHGTQSKTITYTLPGSFGYDSGRALFHTQTVIGIACASCHPEARDDGLVWQFDAEGKRRTQSVAGRILERGPYHWSGDMADLPTLMDNVFAQRMAGGTVSRSQHLSLGPWLDRVAAPQPPTPADPAAVDRGRDLFQSTDVGCATCHSGPLFTNHTLVDVGTGGTFKVPSLLGVGARPPFLHDGCAATLVDRFGACGGGDKHGHTSQLSQAQLADLVSYLESL